ncbi:MAG TPA: phosphoserine transaminase, partial [Acidimicrobiaceae bacterium]|nr:phosphoserine transaminase [Acidimicrobiaceae bacterium]
MSSPAPPAPAAPPAAGPRSITIPAGLLPADGRFGSGPSKVRPEAAAEVAAQGRSLLGTSHRRDGVRSLVGRLRAGLAELFGIAAGWEVLLGNGGTTTFWDAASFGLVVDRSRHYCFGEFSDKFAGVVRRAPHLADPDVVESAPGTHPDPNAGAPGGTSGGTPGGIDTVALTHNETSTGVCMPVRRPDWARAASSAGPPSPDGRPLVLVDATSAAGAMPWDPAEADCYYFAPQKAFAADGGLWIALCGPAAVERIERLGGTGPAGGRWAPATLDLTLALSNSRQNQTYNTPALATILLTLNTLEWMLAAGGLEWSAARARANSDTVYDWATARDWCRPFVDDAEMRSPVVCTVDFDGVSADDIAAVLRANGIVDTEGYRKLGRNQLRIAAFPAIDTADVEALCACIDFV